MALAKILIVDDELSMRELLQIFFEGDGYTTTAVGSAEEALQVLSGEQFDLIISDLNMSNMSGLDLLKIVKKKTP